MAGCRCVPYIFGNKQPPQMVAYSDLNIGGETPRVFFFGLIQGQNLQAWQNDRFCYCWMTSYLGMLWNWLMNVGSKPYRFQGSDGSAKMECFRFQTLAVANWQWNRNCIFLKHYLHSRIVVTFTSSLPESEHQNSSWDLKFNPRFWFIMELRGVKNNEVVATQNFFTGIHCGEWSNLTLRHLFQSGLVKTRQREFWIFFLFLWAWSWFIRILKIGHQPRFMAVYGSFHHSFFGNPTQKYPQQFVWQIVSMCKGFLVLSSGSKGHGWLETNDYPE